LELNGEYLIHEAEDIKQPVENLKRAVRAHWEKESCGQRYGRGEGAEFYRAIDAERYRLDWMIPEFAGFDRYAGKQVLEVGLGTGADFIRWVRAGAAAHGRDLTAASIAHILARLSFEPRHGFADARQGDAEALDLPDNSMDLYYSWGCLHHTPDTEKAIGEAYRVLKPGGELKILIYHRRSVCALLVWLTRGVWRGKGLRRSVADHLESPGTKAYTRGEAARLVRQFQDVEIRTWLSAGDLLLNKRSQRNAGRFWTLCYALYPRPLIRLLGNRWGLGLTIHARKGVLR
jgi:SAM-dependent methyltransferase